MTGGATSKRQAHKILAAILASADPTRDDPSGATDAGFRSGCPAGKPPEGRRRDTQACLRIGPFASVEPADHGGHHLRQQHCRRGQRRQANSRSGETNTSQRDGLRFGKRCERVRHRRLHNACALAQGPTYRMSRSHPIRLNLRLAQLTPRRLGTRQTGVRKRLRTPNRGRQNQVNKALMVSLVRAIPRADRAR